MYIITFSDQSDLPLRLEINYFQTFAASLLTYRTYRGGGAQGVKKNLTKVFQCKLLMTQIRMERIENKNDDVIQVSDKLTKFSWCF